jgi:hypothetical protein
MSRLLELLARRGFGAASALDIGFAATRAGPGIEILTFACCRMEASATSSVPDWRSIAAASRRALRQTAAKLDVLVQDLSEVCLVAAIRFLIDDGPSLQADASAAFGAEGGPVAAGAVRAVQTCLDETLPTLRCARLCSATTLSSLAPDANPAEPFPETHPLVAGDESWLRQELGGRAGSAGTGDLRRAAAVRVAAYAAQGRALSAFFAARRGFLFSAERPADLKTRMFRAGLPGNARLPMLVCGPPASRR